MEKEKGFPAIVGFTFPYRLVLTNESDKWEPTLDHHII
jgi:hypothetical protein